MDDLRGDGGSGTGYHGYMGDAVLFEQVMIRKGMAGKE